MRVATTTSRSLKLLSLFVSGRVWGGNELADQLDVSARTLRRDIDTLRDLGYPIDTVKGPRGGYRLGAGGSLPPLLFDDDQAVAVALALQTAPVTVTGLEDAAARARATLHQVMPARLKAEVESMNLTSIRNQWDFAAPPIEPEVLQAVGQAVRRGHVLQFDYLRPDGSRPDLRDADFVPPPRVEPHHLVLWAGRWYLVAYELHDDGWQIFRVDRIHPHAATGLPFTRRTLPAVNVATYVMRSYDRGDTPASWQCLGTAVLGLPADLVARWAPGGSVIEYVSPGQTQMTLGAWSWAGIAGILATFDTDLSAVEPAELRAACHRLARRFELV